MKNRQIVNIINFIRGVEPREPVDLAEPVTEQIKLMKKHGLKGTFLLQYDAFILPEYSELMKSLDSEQFEIGVWHEIVQPMAEKAGIVWKGRFPWDWHAHCGFPVGYTKEEREKLIDVLFEDYKKIMGCYPKVFGSWFFDSHTIRYACEKYGLDAICNCKEQYGTDGYTLWGGYYGQGYYPAKTNVFLPAQTEENQISVPVFRMLGCDPVYQFDLGTSVDSDETWQMVSSLEPIYENSGGSPDWVDWYMRENFNGECLSFGYAQAGQENSFGWSSMKDGLEYQFPLFEELQREGKIQVEKLGDTGRRYKKTYKTTPASAISAHTAFDDENKNSLWYSSKYYRINLYGDGGRMRIRDLHVFSEKFTDPYEDKLCTINEAFYESLPVTDGNRQSGNGVLAGTYLLDKNGNEIGTHTKMEFAEKGGSTAEIKYGDVTFVLSEKTVEISYKEDFAAENRVGKDRGHTGEIVSCTDKMITFSFKGVTYGIKMLKGYFDGRLMRSENKRIEFEIIG